MQIAIPRASPRHFAPNAAPVLEFAKVSRHYSVSLDRHTEAVKQFTERRDLARQSAGSGLAVRHHLPVDRRRLALRVLRAGLIHPAHCGLVH